MDTHTPTKPAAPGIDGALPEAVLLLAELARGGPEGHLGPVVSIEAREWLLVVGLDPQHPAKSAQLGRWLDFLDGPDLVAHRRTRTAREVRLNLRGRYLFGDPEMRGAAAPLVVHTTYTADEPDQLRRIRDGIGIYSPAHLLAQLAAHDNEEI